MSNLTAEELKEAKAYAKKHGHHGTKGGWIVGKRGQRITFGWRRYYEKFIDTVELPEDWGKLPGESNEGPVEFSGKFASWTTEDTDAMLRSVNNEGVTTQAIPVKMSVTFNNAQKEALNLLRRVEDFYWQIQKGAEGWDSGFVPLIGDIHGFLRSQET